MNCPSCHQPLTPGAAFCDNCGASVSAAPQAPMGQPAQPMGMMPPIGGGGANCPSCGSPNTPGSAFCDSCGAALSQAAPMAAPIQAGQGYVPTPPPMAAPAAGGMNCPNCKAALTPGSAFCDNCGQSVSGVFQGGQQAGGQQMGGYPQQGQQQGSYQPQQGSYQPQQGGYQPQQGGYQPQQGGYQQQQGGYQQQQPGYGAAPMLTPRLVVEGSNTPLNVPAGKNEIVIGREDAVSGNFPEVDLGPFKGEDLGVSRRHAKLIIQGTQCFLEDLQATNGTYINKQRLPAGQRQPINNGDELRFGKVAVRFYTS
jgi:pSer/pThr/pTyr-binding forkhead associated (FHA) protein